MQLHQLKRREFITLSGGVVAARGAGALVRNVPRFRRMCISLF
jgi:hypothetical protein